MNQSTTVLVTGATGYIGGRLAPRLSSYWVRWITPIPSGVSAPLIDGLRNEVVVRDNLARELFPRIQPQDYDAHTVVGVMPPGFAFPQNEKLWTALHTCSPHLERGAGPALDVFGRLAPNATREQAHTELATIGDRAAADFPETNARLRPRVLPYTHSLDGVRGVTLL